MNKNLFHVYRNTSMGRETYLHSLYFCKMLNIGLTVYIPASTHFSLDLDSEMIRIDLDESYLTAPESAPDRVQKLAALDGIDVTIFYPEPSPGSGLSGSRQDFSFMTCPRSISDLSSKIGLGFIGAKVRRIIHSAGFPVLITSPVFKPWENITVLFGGSNNSINALRLGLYIARHTGLPLNMITYLEKDLSFYQKAIAEAVLTQEVNQSVACWYQFQDGSLEEHLYAVPHDSLVVVGAYGHGGIKALLFGSKMEKIQTTLTNNLLIVGPQVPIPNGFHQVPTLETEPRVIGTCPSAVTER